MDWVETLSGVDAAALAILSLAAIRGLYIGAVREAFSLAAVAVACIAVRLGTQPAAAWLGANAPFDLSPLAATVLAGVVLAVGSLIAVGTAGRAIRTGIRAAGLGLWDRIAGGAFGAAEGALVVAVAVAIAAGALGPEHDALRETHTLAAYDSAMEFATGDRLEDVAAPPLEIRR